MTEEQLEKIKNIIADRARLLDDEDRRPCKDVVKIILECIVMSYTKTKKESKDAPLESANTEEEKKIIDLLNALRNKL